MPRVRWLLPVFIWLTVACAGSAGSIATPLASPATGSQPTTQPVTITWSFWGDPGEQEVNQRVARAFERENPRIKVELIFTPWETYFTTREKEWANQTAPDVMFLNNIPGYAARGALYNLDALSQRDGFSTADFYPALLEQFRYQSQLYGLPRDNDTKVLYYNKALFDQAGVAYPKAGWTWDDLRATAKALTKRDAAGQTSQYGLAWEANLWWKLWVWQNGGEVLDDPFRPTRVLLESPEAIAGIQFLADLYNVDRVLPPYDQAKTSEAIADWFSQGKVAMAFGNHSFVPMFAQAAGLNWDVAGLPRAPGKERSVNVAGGAGYTLSRWTKQPEAAWTFLKFLEGARGQALFAETGVITPARSSVREDHVFLRERPYNAQIFLAETRNGKPIFNFPRANDVNSLLDEALAPVWRGQQSPAEAVRQVIPQLEALIRS